MKVYRDVVRCKRRRNRDLNAKKISMGSQSLNADEDDDDDDEALS